jgi:predicted Holliday junction resolvase-like endonuclease
MKKRLYSAALILLLGIGVSAQKTNSVKQEVKKDAKKVGTAVKDGAEWTGKTAEKGYDATKKGVKKATKWTKKTAKKGADAVDKSYQNVKADIKKD